MNFLWVSEALRGQRHGTRLMDEAEQMARERGAIGSTLETFTSQAPGFYAKRGYSDLAVSTTIRQAMRNYI